MRSEAQNEASRANGAKSHGPITEEGKQRSSQNAVKHGLTARSVVLCHEDRELFNQLEQDYIDSLRPCTVFELHLVQRIAVCEWRMRRAYSVATAITDQSLMDHKAQDEAENPGLDDDLRTALAFMRVDKYLAAVDRSEARFERTQARALAEFHRQRKLRPADAQPIQVTRPDVSTTGRDPAQYVKRPSEPKPAAPTPPHPEPCIVLAPYPKPEEDEFGDVLPPIPQPPRAA